MKLEADVSRELEPGDRTRRRVQDAVEEAAEDDPDFAAVLEALLGRAGRGARRRAIARRDRPAAERKASRSAISTPRPIPSADSQAAGQQAGTGMPGDAETSPPDSRLNLHDGKGVQVGDGNEQVNQFIATYVEHQVVVGPTADPARSGWEQGTPGGPARMPSVWNVPGRLNTFTARADMLDDIARALAAKRPGRRGPAVSITTLGGLGGVGKTQLAVEYAWRHAAGYSLAWWMDAEEASLLPGQVAALGARLGLPSAGRVDMDAASVLAWLAGHDGWLVRQTQPIPWARRPGSAEGKGTE